MLTGGRESSSLGYVTDSSHGHGTLLNSMPMQIFAVITQTLILCEFSLFKKGLYLSGLQMAIIMGLESIFGT
jgi:hypothetical protein